MVTNLVLGLCLSSLNVKLLKIDILLQRDAYCQAYSHCKVCLSFLKVNREW